MKSTTQQLKRDDATGRIEPQPAPATTRRVTEKTHEAIDKVASSAEETERALREKAAQAEAQMRELGGKVQQHVDQSSQQVKQYVQENPLASAAIAFAAGFLVSALIRR